MKRRKRHAQNCDGDGLGRRGAGWLVASVLAAEQTTIFTTKDFARTGRCGRTRPITRNNTPGQLTGHGAEYRALPRTVARSAPRDVYGSEGTGTAGRDESRQPLSVQDARPSTIRRGLRMRRAGPSTPRRRSPIGAARWDAARCRGRPRTGERRRQILTPKYQEYYVQQLKAASEARTWRRRSMCLPRGFFASLSAGIRRHAQQGLDACPSSNTENTTRWIYTDGSGHSPEAIQLSQMARGIGRFLERRHAGRPHQPDPGLEGRTGSASSPTSSKPSRNTGAWVTGSTARSRSMTRCVRGAGVAEGEFHLEQGHQAGGPADLQHVHR